MKKSIKDFVDDELKEFSMYVLEGRAIPSGIDGMKPVQRKIIRAALDLCKGNKIKVAELGSSLASYNYAHGDAADSVVNMAREFDNNISLLEQHGSFGTRLIKDAAAPRYIYTKLSENFASYFKDNEVITPHKERDNPEPQQYLPIIPWVLVNGVRGIAVGYATNILPRDPEALRMACLDYITIGKIKKGRDPLLPKFPNFIGEVIQTEEDNKYESMGIIENKGLVYKITELPIGYERESYLKVLNKLMDDNKIIDYEDPCDDGFVFNIKVTRKQRTTISKNPLKYFKLIKKHSENITVLDEHGKLKLFDNPYDLIEWFCDFRLLKCQEKIDFILKKLHIEKNKLEAKLKFINMVKEEDNISIKNVSKKELLEFIDTHISKEEYAKEFIRIPLYDFTIEKIKELEKLLDKNLSEYKLWDKKTDKTYFKELLLGI